MYNVFSLHLLIKDIRWLFPHRKELKWLICIQKELYSTELLEMNEKATELQKPSQEDIQEYLAEKADLEKKQSGSYLSTFTY
jgi:hypothetical protein